MMNKMVGITVATGIDRIPGNLGKQFLGFTYKNRLPNALKEAQFVDRGCLPQMTENHIS